MGQILSFASARAKLAQAREVSLTATCHDFLADLTVAERSPRTIDQHRAELRRYGVWLDEHIMDWRTVTPADLASYTRTRAHLSPSSRSALITTLHVFYAWCVEQEILQASPAERLKTPKRTKAAPRALNSSQIRILLTYLDQELHDAQIRAEQVGIAGISSESRIQRDQALLLTALYTGMRAAELAALRWPAVDLESGILVVEKGKGRKGRALKIHPDLLPILKAWKITQGLGSADAPVFVLSGHEPLVPNRVGKIARRYAKATGLPLTAHVLRHTFATHALRNSGNIYAVSKALGHGQLQQTTIYVRVDARDGEPAIDAMPNLNAW